MQDLLTAKEIPTYTITGKLQSDIEQLIISANQIFYVGKACYELEWLIGEIHNRIFAVITDLGSVIRQAEKIALMLRGEN